MTSVFRDLERYMETAPIVNAYEPDVHGGGGHPGKFSVVLSGGLTTLVKPSWTAPNAAVMVRNEVAAWQFVDLMSWQHLMGATVLRTVTHPTTGASGEASLQVLWPANDYCVDVGKFDEGDRWKAALVDTVLQNSDRGGGNWLGVPKGGEKPNLVLIDHGYTLLASTATTSAFVEMQKGQSVPLPLIDDLQRFVSSDPLRSRLVETVGAEAVIGMIERSQAILRNGHLA